MHYRRAGLNKAEGRCKNRAGATSGNNAPSPRPADGSRRTFPAFRGAGAICCSRDAARNTAPGSPNSRALFITIIAEAQVSSTSYLLSRCVRTTTADGFLCIKYHLVRRRSFRRRILCGVTNFAVSFGVGPDVRRIFVRLIQRKVAN